MQQRLYQFNAPTIEALNKYGMGYYAEPGMDYLCDEILKISPAESLEYQLASAELYTMYEQAAQHAIDHNLWQKMGIPENAIDIIKYSWEKRHQHLHLYGRFDIAGIVDGTAAKLIEFNADTASILPETAVVQAYQLELAKIEGAKQFNHLEKGLEERFLQLFRANSRKTPSILLSDLGHPEDALNLDIIEAAAEAAGLESEQSDLEYIHFSPDEGIFIQASEHEYLQFDFWFKFIPWEWIAYEEPEMLDILTQIVKNDLCVIINPAYTMLFQSKAMLQLLWELFPNHRLLLKTQNNPSQFAQQDYVKKVIFGREGENIEIFSKTGRCLEKNDGDFGEFESVYQQFVPLPKDDKGNVYQAGVYFTHQAVALSFRRKQGLIVDTDSEFIGHFVQ